MLFIDLACTAVTDVDDVCYWLFQLLDASLPARLLPPWLSWLFMVLSWRCWWQPKHIFQQFMSVDCWRKWSISKDRHQWFGCQTSDRCYRPTTIPFNRSKVLSSDMNTIVFLTIHEADALMYGINKKATWSNFIQSNQRWCQCVCLDKPSRRIGHTLVFGWANPEIIQTQIWRLSLRRSESREFLIQIRIVWLDCQGEHIITTFCRFLDLISISKNFIAINQIDALNFLITDKGVVFWIAKENEANDEL